MVAAPLAFGVRRSAFESTADPEPTALPEDRTPNAKRQTPTTERCPQCGQQRPRAELWHKHHRLTCCTACYQQRRQDKRRRWQEANREKRNRQRRQGGMPCPPYLSWMAWSLGPGHEAVAVAMDPQEPDAVVLPAYGACSCDEAGCVHLVVALLARPQESP